MSALQLTPNQLRSVLNLQCWKPTEIEIEMYLQQECLSCKIILLGDKYVKSALKYFKSVDKLHGNFRG